MCKFGAANVIISDNGSYFAYKEVRNYAAKLGIIRKFNVPFAPWMGGFFESMVKSLKSILRKVIRNKRLNDEMVTVLKEIENITNNRPLSYVYYDDVQEPLTPNKLIYGKNLNVCINDVKNNVNFIGDVYKQSIHLETLIQSFWGIWRKEYLRQCS